MTERENIEEVYGLVQPDWSRDREDAVWGAMTVRRRRGVVVRRTALAVAAAAAIGISAWTFWSYQSGDHGNVRSVVPVAAAPRAKEATRVIVLNDGSEITGLSDGFRIATEQQDAREVRVRILEGSGEFSVTRNPARRFLVIHGDVTVTVVGTVFSVTPEEGRVSVAVREGRVRVSWPEGESALSAGQKGIYPPHQKIADGPSKEVRRSTSPRGEETWREAAARGDFETASAMITRPADVRDTVEELMLAADVMRQSNRPEDAVRYLARVSKDHETDSRASMAEFTRGRILLFQLGRPGQAAEAFAAARRLSPDSSLAQDALAREVEALHQAGNADLAKARAREYVQRYPQGRRIDAVRQMGGLESDGQTR